MDDNISVGTVYSIDDNILSILYMDSNRQMCQNNGILERVSLFTPPLEGGEYHASFKGTAKSC